MILVHDGTRHECELSSERIGEVFSIRKFRHITDYYAHSIGDRPQVDWHRLEDHLRSTADRASTFAQAFSSTEWARLAGLWHDLGKYQAEFQARLRGEPLRIEHAVIGALHASLLGPEGLPLAWVIAGHHAGLANKTKRIDGGPAPLDDRLKISFAAYEGCLKPVPTNITRHTLPPLPIFLTPIDQADRKQLARRSVFWIRMLFSALVDADYLDTESAIAGDRALARGAGDTIEALRERLEVVIQSMLDNISEEDSATPINVARRAVLADCLEAASKPPGLFHLTAPTGCGKTLSSMAFALRHADEHGLVRVITVLPFTSIIEQNAKVYRDALGKQNVVEHHSSLTQARRRETLGEEITTQHERAEENWDAPVIVTTTVQFFESLHASRPSACRKLHNIVRSVIVLDEVQTLPPGLLMPILDSLEQLVEHYGCTVVLSTATPPALTRRDTMPTGLPKGQPILKEADQLFRTLSRVRYHWPDPDTPPTDWESLAQQISTHEQALVVVDRRADAVALARAVAKRCESFHLSALMCPAHRLDSIEQVRQALILGQPCRVVSTQLIEAGVDLDFPVVYRAMAGLDHIVQAAGRCNREGRCDQGDVYIFRPPKAPPPGELRLGRDVTETMLRGTEKELDLEDPAIFDRYFRGFYGNVEDRKGILREQHEFNFASVARQFKMIDDANRVAVLCPYDEKARETLQTYRQAQEEGCLNREIYRSLQPYLVQIYTNQIDDLKREGVVLELAEGLYELAPGFTKRYDARYGLQLDGDAKANPGELIT